MGKASRAKENKKPQLVIKPEKSRFGLWVTLVTIIVFGIIAAIVVTTSITANNKNSVDQATETPAGVQYDGLAVTADGLADTPPQPVKTTFEATPPVEGINNLSLYIDYSCNHCFDFENANFETIENMLDTGTIDQLTIHPLGFLGAYSVAGANALYCAAEYAPETVLDVHKTLMSAMETQPLKGKLITLLKDNGANLTEEYETCIRGGKYDQLVSAASERAVEGPIPTATGTQNIAGTPTILMNGQKYQQNPSDNATFTQFVLTIAEGGTLPGQTIGTDPVEETELTENQTPVEETETE